MTSISKDILFHVSEFLEKIIFNLCLKLLCEFVDFKLFQTIGVGYDKFFRPEHVF